MELVYTIPPYTGDVKVISLAQAKKQLRIEHEYEDAEIADFIEMAIAEAQNYMGRLLRPQEITFGVKGWQKDNVFPLGPVTAVTGVGYLKSGEEQHTALVITGYKLYNFGKNKDLLLIKEAAYSFQLELETLDAVQITATVGYEDGEVPKDIINAVLLLLTDKYEYRGEKETKTNRSSRNLMRPYKQWV